jgi:hypothetical protein
MKFNFEIIEGCRNVVSPVDSGEDALTTAGETPALPKSSFELFPVSAKY